MDLDQNRSPPVLPQTPWRDRVFGEIDAHIATLGRDTDECRRHLAQFFPGHTSRRQLSDQDLIRFNRRLDWEVSIIGDTKTVIVSRNE